jgi:plasmid stabilization system protein ParE
MAPDSVLSSGAWTWSTTSSPPRSAVGGQPRGCAHRCPSRTPVSERFTVRWAQVAVEDLLSIMGYVVDRDGVDAAERLYGRITEAAQKLETMPRRCRVVPELGAEGITGYRELLVGPYRLMFAIRDGDVVGAGCRRWSPRSRRAADRTRAPGRSLRRERLTTEPQQLRVARLRQRAAKRPPQGADRRPATAAAPERELGVSAGRFRRPNCGGGSPRRARSWCCGAHR